MCYFPDQYSSIVCPEDTEQKSSVQKEISQRLNNLTKPWWHLLRLGYRYPISPFDTVPYDPPTGK